VNVRKHLGELRVEIERRYIEEAEEERKKSS